MKIGEFAAATDTTPKILRYYDEIGLLSPARDEGGNGYRVYLPSQARYVSWIRILQHLGFSLREIREVLYQPVERRALLGLLRRKQTEINRQYNRMMSRLLQMEKLIAIIEREGFDVDKQFDLMDLSSENVFDLMKNMPNMGSFLERGRHLLELEPQRDYFVLCIDICHFKSVNDQYGHEVGDKVIGAVYMLFEQTVGRAGDYAIAREHGDEFVALAFGGEAQAQEIAKGFNAALDAYSFRELGCGQPVSCRFSAAFGQGGDGGFRDSWSAAKATMDQKKDPPGVLRILK